MLGNQCSTGETWASRSGPRSDARAAGRLAVRAARGEGASARDAAALRRDVEPASSGNRPGRTAARPARPRRISASGTDVVRQRLGRRTRGITPASRSGMSVMGGTVVRGRAAGRDRPRRSPGRSNDSPGQRARSPAAAPATDRAGRQVVVDDAARLHRRVGGRRADEPEAERLELLGQRPALRRSAPARPPTWPAARRRAVGAYDHSTSSSVRPAACSAPQRAGVGDRRLDLGAVPHDAGVGHEPRDVVVVELRDDLGVEPGERRPERRPLAQDRDPREPGLERPRARPARTARARRARARPTPRRGTARRGGCRRRSSGR